MESASLNASTTVVLLSTMDMSFWLGIEITVSQAFRKSDRPPSPRFMRLGPSKLKGRVTIPTVRISSSRAIWAILAAAPVPVPPPIPPVMNTISAPPSISVITSRSASTASRPTSAFAPAPRPLVRFLPIWILCFAALFSRSWASVFTTMKSTPCIPAWIMRFTAFPPAPPTPMTFNFAFCSAMLSNSNNIGLLLWFGG